MQRVMVVKCIPSVDLVSDHKLLLMDLREKMREGIQLHRKGVSECGR